MRQKGIMGKKELLMKYIHANEDKVQELVSSIPSMINLMLKVTRKQSSVSKEISKNLSKLQINIKEIRT